VIRLSYILKFPEVSYFMRKVGLALVCGVFAILHGCKNSTVPKGTAANEGEDDADKKEVLSTHWGEDESVIESGHVDVEGGDLETDKPAGPSKAEAKCMAFVESCLKLAKNSEGPMARKGVRELSKGLLRHLMVLEEKEFVRLGKKQVIEFFSDPTSFKNGKSNPNWKNFNESKDKDSYAETFLQRIFQIAVADK
jgi:hypothetical protein